jgi:SAM-dependent methyltransferase
MSHNLTETAAGLRDKIRRNVGEVGVGGTMRRAAVVVLRKVFGRKSAAQRQAHAFDLKYGTDTSGTIEPASMDIPRGSVAHAKRYQTAIVEVFMEILKDLSVQSEKFVFIDLGSGKGRALMLASQFPFKEIIGVELSADLHDVACRNIQIYKKQEPVSCEIRSVCADASRFDIPLEPIVFYLFNPFDEQVMNAVLANIESSLQTLHRDIYIAYLKPVCRKSFDESRFFTIEHDADRYVIYKSSPAARTAAITR